MITTRKKQSFGIAAVELGAPVSTVPSIPVKDRKSTRLNSSHCIVSRMPSSA